MHILKTYYFPNYPSQEMGMLAVVLIVGSGATALSSSLPVLMALNWLTTSPNAHRRFPYSALDLFAPTTVLTFYVGFKFFRSKIFKFFSLNFLVHIFGIVTKICI